MKKNQLPTQTDIQGDTKKNIFIARFNATAKAEEILRNAHEEKWVQFWKQKVQPMRPLRPETRNGEKQVSDRDADELFAALQLPGVQLKRMKREKIEVMFRKLITPDNSDEIVDGGGRLRAPGGGLKRWPNNIDANGQTKKSSPINLDNETVQIGGKLLNYLDKKMETQSSNRFLLKVFNQQGIYRSASNNNHLIKDKKWQKLNDKRIINVIEFQKRLKRSRPSFKNNIFPGLLHCSSNP